MRTVAIQHTPGTGVSLPSSGLAQQLGRAASQPTPAAQITFSSASARGGIVGRAAVSASSAEERQRRVDRAQRFAATASRAHAASPVRGL